jgi:DnaK suppressor protein
MKAPLDPQAVSTLANALRARLQTLRGTIREHLEKSDDDRARLLADRVGDAEDESVADLIVDLDLAEIDRDVEEIRDVEAALARMRDGSYGVCASCRGAIAFERLTAYPSAKRCVRCQRLYEKTYVQKGHPTL